MKRFCLIAAAAALIVGSASTQQASAEGRLADRWAHRHARGMSWHAPYIHTATGAPVAFIVPPTAHMQTRWGWGVSQGTMSPIYHQFRRTHPGEAYEVGGDQFNHTPRWPSHTDQFGVFYIRGPY